MQSILKNRVWDFFGVTWSRTRVFRSETQCLRRENPPTATTTASGVRYYGYRYYSPTLGRFVNRDPLGEEAHLRKFLNNKSYRARRRLCRLSHSLPAYRFVDNRSINSVDIDGRISLAWGAVPAFIGYCCIKHLLNIREKTNDDITQIWTSWPYGYDTGDEGGPSDALQHCIGSCRANQHPGFCLSSAAVRTAINWLDYQSDAPDRLNCIDDDGGIIPCPPPPKVQQS